MDINHLDNDFAKTAKLFETYKEALSQDNNDSLIEQTKDKIVIQFWRIIQKTKSISDEMKEQSDLIVKKVVYCLNNYSNKASEDFCKLTYSSIIKVLKGNVDTESFELKSGMHISDTEDRKRKTINKAYKQFITFRNENKNEFIEYAVSYLGFDHKDLEEYLFPKQSVSLFMQSKNDEEYCVVDKYLDSSKSSDTAEIQNSIEQLQEQFKAIDALWLKQKEDARPILSELLTRELLTDFKKNTVSETVIETLKLPQFVCKDMIDSFFNNINFILPTQQDIGQKYGITKSAASVKLTRFIEKLKEQ